MKSKTFRVSGIIILLCLMIFYGFKRERFLLVFDASTLFKFLNRYPRTSITDYKKEMSGLMGFSLSPKLISSVLFSLVFLILTTLIIHLSFRKSVFTKITASLFLIYMILCFFFLQLANYGVDYRLSAGLSHYLEDLFLSPFPLMMLVPLFLLADRIVPKKEG